MAASEITQNALKKKESERRKRRRLGDRENQGTRGEALRQTSADQKMIKVDVHIKIFCKYSNCVKSQVTVNLSSMEKLGNAN